MKENIRLLHINDLHSHFESFPKLERFVNQIRAENQELICFDIGDNIDKSHPLSDATGGKANIDLMNQIGIQYATIGNNEGIGLTKEELNHVYDEAQFDVIIGNLKDEGKQPTWGKPYSIYKTKQGTQIAILAYTFPYTLTYHPNGWEVLDPIVCIQNDLEISELKNADFIILMSHLGLPFDEKIAQLYPEIDLILGSHTHHLLEDGAQLNGVNLAAAGKYGYYIGDIQLTFENHQNTDILIETHEMSHYPSQKTDYEWTEQLVTRGKTLLARDFVSQFATPLSFEETCQKIIDAMMWEADADLCIINSGLILDAFPSRLTKETLQSILPHQMRLASLEVNRNELEQICHDVFTQAALLKNQSIRGMGFRGKEFGELLTGGFTYKNKK